MSPSTPHESLVAECHDVAHEVFAAIRRHAEPELLSIDLTMGQFKALATLTSFGPQSVGELGRRLGLSEPAASLLADKLEDLGLASRERDPGDRRRTLVSATAAAQELAARLRQGRDEQIIEWLDALTDEELRGLLGGFRSLLRVTAATAGVAPSATAAASAPDAAAAPRPRPARGEMSDG